jgi:hypothetical protein
MTTHYLSIRDNWQAAANAGGAKLELIVSSILSDYLAKTYPGEFAVTNHPKDLDQFYLEEARRRAPDDFIKPENPQVGDIWYDESSATFVKKTDTGVKRAVMGCIPDICIRHVASNQRYFLECKNQGDAGNAHERAAKYATPSVIDGIRRKLGVTYHPIGFVFSGEMVEDVKYRYELETTYEFIQEHLLMWRTGRSVDVLCEWVDRVIIPLMKG